MAAPALRPQTLEEHLIWWAIVGTWGVWLVGGLYVLGPVLGYGLLGLAIARWIGLADGRPPRLAALPISAVMWTAGMLVMAATLVIAHINFELGATQTLKSFVGWMKGWALFAVFVLAGAMLSIRPAILYRATGLLALQTLLLAPLFYAAGLLSLPDVLYVSPLSIVGGPGPEFFDVSLYAIDETNGQLRWRFFSPWATAAAFCAGIGFIFAIFERRTLWRVAGFGAAIVVCWMAGSRLSMVALPAILLLTLAAARVRHPPVILAAGLALVCLVLLSDHVVHAFEDVTTAFEQARAASSRVRATLASIAYHRWWAEAPLFGHGVVERGPHLVQFMAIGSHHTWHGLLFVKGAVGLAALALPLAWSVFEFTLKAQADRVARAALAVVLALALFSFGDNLEIVAYLIWPGLVLIGIASKRRLRNPYRGRLGAQV